MIGALALVLTGFVNLCGVPSARRSQSEIDPAVVEGYRLFAKGNCYEVGERARVLSASQSGAPRERHLRLLRAYCVELGGDVSAARDLYSSIGSSSETPGLEAAMRLRELARLEGMGVTRAQLKERVLAERAKSPPRPKPIRRADPSYPQWVVEAGVEGWATVGFEIGSDGTVADPLILESKPPFVFDRAVVEAVRAWTYERSDHREPIRDVVKLQFELDRSEAQLPDPDPTARYRYVRRSPLLLVSRARRCFALSLAR